MPISLIANRVARLLALGALLAACSSPPAGVVDLDGLAQDPLAGDAAAQVLVFVRSDCPIANRYAPELKRLAERFAGQRVALHLVYPDPDEAPATIRKHLDEYRLSDAKLGALRDPQHSLVSLAHAKVTPSAAVFVRGELAYSGRIDDTWVAFGKFRPQPTVRDLVDAVDAVLAGKAPAARETVAIGCYIPALQGEGE